jgi:hypothetical protein
LRRKSRLFAGITLCQLALRSRLVASVVVAVFPGFHGSLMGNPALSKDIATNHG